MAQIAPGIFRAADMRGRVSEEELNPYTVELIGKGYGTFLAKHGIRTAVVGYDSRDCSVSFNQALTYGLLSTGCDVVNIGLVVTPMVYWAQYYFKAEGGAMITGSHNPPDWSGFKMARGYSYTIVGEEVQEIRRIIEDDDFAIGEGKLQCHDVTEAYFDDLLARSNVTKSFKVVVDAGNGTAGKYAPELFCRAGCEVIELYCDLDTSFPNHFPDPTIVESRDDLRAKIIETGADLGVSFDGDADRLGVNDELGNIIWSDRLMILWARDILRKQPGASIVFDVKCSRSLIEDIRAHSGVPFMERTGHPFIKKRLKEVQAALAGEMSGHIFFVENYYGFDDSLYAALRLLEYLSHTDKKLSEVMAEIPKYEATPELRLECPDELKYQISDAIAERFREDQASGRDKEVVEVIDIDGARVEFKDGWGLVRASSNLPTLVLRFEGKTKELADKYKEMFREKLIAEYDTVLAKEPKLLQAVRDKWENEEEWDKELKGVERK